MPADLDLAGLKVEVVDMTEGLGITKKYSFLGVHVQLGFTFPRWENVDGATKDSKQLEVWPLAGADCHQG